MPSWIRVGVNLEDGLARVEAGVGQREGDQRVDGARADVEDRVGLGDDGVGLGLPPLPPITPMLQGWSSAIAFAVDAGADRDFEQHRQLGEFLPGLEITVPPPATITGRSERVSRLYKSPRSAFRAARAVGGEGLAGRFGGDARVGHRLGEHILRHHDVDRARSPGGGVAEGAADGTSGICRRASSVVLHFAAARSNLLLVDCGQRPLCSSS